MCVGTLGLVFGGLGRLGDGCGDVWGAGRQIQGTPEVKSGVNATLLPL